MAKENKKLDKENSGFSHETIETNSFLMIILILVTVAFGGIVEIIPLFYQKSTTEPIKGLQPYTAVQLMGRDVYIREGCYNCHSQMIRPFRAETLRYGHYSVAGESVYDHPFQWGSKRTGPDLARVGGRYSDEWHRVHLNNPRDVVPESIMPAYPWLEKTEVDATVVAQRMKALKKELKFELHIPFEIYYSKTRYIIQSLRNTNITYKPIKSELKRFF